jgi:hypothetical protein
MFKFANNIDLNLLNFLPQSVMAHPNDFSIAFLDAFLLELFGGIMFGLLKKLALMEALSGEAHVALLAT